MFSTVFIPTFQLAGFFADDDDEELVTPIMEAGLSPLSWLLCLMSCSGYNTGVVMNKRRKEVKELRKKRRNMGDQRSLCPKKILPLNKRNIKSFFTHC